MLSISVIFWQKDFSKQEVRTQMFEEQFKPQFPTLIQFHSCSDLCESLSTKKQCMADTESRCTGTQRQHIESQNGLG